MPDHHEWYRARRHEELARDHRMARDACYRHREKAKQGVGAALLVGATVMMARSFFGPFVP